MNNIGVAISTYFGEDTDRRRLYIFKHSIQSLLNSNFPGKIFLVDDGSSIDTHLDCVKNESRVIIYKKNKRKGVACTKNTGIRLLLDAECDIGFLVDDDIIFNNDVWYKNYIEAITLTKIPSFSYFIGRNNVIRFNINNFPIVRTPHVNGCLITFTKSLIEEIGYFKVLPYEFGHEHSNFSMRCLKKNKIPFFCDIDSSNIDISFLPDSAQFKSVPNIDIKRFKENEDIALSQLDKEPLIE